MFVFESGFVDEMEGILKRVLKNPLVKIPKPFSCSLCMCFWSCLIYTIVLGRVTLFNVAIILFFALMEDVLSEIYYIIKDC